MLCYRILYKNETGERDSVVYEGVDKFIPLDSNDLDILIEYFFMLANPNCIIVEISKYFLSDK